MTEKQLTALMDWVREMTRKAILEATDGDGWKHESTVATAEDNLYAAFGIEAPQGPGESPR